MWMQTALIRIFLTNALVKRDTLAMDAHVQVHLISSSKMTINVSPSTVLAHRYARFSQDAEFSYRLKQIYSVDIVDECRNTSRLYQTLASEAKGNMYNAVLCRYFFLEWSDPKNVCDINTKQTKKSHRPHHCQEIAIIIHHHPRHHHFDHHHYKHFCLHIYIDECSEKIYVCDVNAKCTNINGSHNCTCTDGLLLKFPII